MCGILGYISNAYAVNRSLFENELHKLKHRGPDAFGISFQNGDKYCLGHTRLAFQDLSDAGTQPMCSTDGNCWITFNGEIYNFIELREELKHSYSFTTETDTEVLLAAYQTWGISFINRLKGMFAFGILDYKKNKIFLVRDRFGIKPMYYSIVDGRLIFASELKSILKLKPTENVLNYTAVVDFFVYRYVPSPKTIWTDINKLPAAHYLSLDISTFEASVHEYWVLNASNNTVSIEQVAQHVNSMLVSSVSEHVRADVPIGSFLSGGYDSSALVVFMKKLKMQPETFSIGFSGWDRSEDQFAKVVADHLHVVNQSVVADEKSLELVDLMPDIYDEPIADISIIPTYMVSKLAQSKVKAVLSGEGADEVFGGYTWHHDFCKKNYSSSVFSFIKQRIFGRDTVSFYANAMAMGWFDRSELKKMLHPRLHRFIPKDVHWFYRKHFDANLSPLKSIQLLDVKCFMGELVLTKIDRASMVNSLEVRVPFLDHELIEYIFSLDEASYYSLDQTKKILFEQIKDKLPKQILDRKKQGFVGPDSYYMDVNWYKKQFRESNLVKFEIIQKKYLDQLLEETYTWKLWKILILEKWFSKWVVD